MEGAPFKRFGQRIWFRFFFVFELECRAMGCTPAEAPKNSSLRLVYEYIFGVSGNHTSALKRQRNRSVR